MCSMPVGLGAKRVRTVMGRPFKGGKGREFYQAGRSLATGQPRIERRRRRAAEPAVVGRNQAVDEAGVRLVQRKVPPPRPTRPQT